MTGKSEPTMTEVQEILERFRWGHTHNERWEELHNGSAQVIVDKKDKIVGVTIRRRCGAATNVEKLFIERVRGDKSIVTSGWNDSGRNLAGKFRVGFADVLEALGRMPDDQLRGGPGLVFEYISDLFG